LKKDQGLTIAHSLYSMSTFHGHTMILEDLDVEQARREAAPFIVDQRALGVWSQDFFRQISPRIISI